MIFVFKDKYLRIIFGLAILILIFTSAFAFLKLKEIDNPLIIHFDVYSGIDFFGEKIDVFGILAAAYAIIAINFFLADFLYNRERFLSYIFTFTSLGLAILILISVSVIISIN